MSQFRTSNIKIKGISSVYGNEYLSIDKIECIKNDKEKIFDLKSKIGLKGVYKASPGITAFDLCLSAVKKIKKETNLIDKNIKTIIFVTQTPDYFLPSNAALMHKYLNLDISCACFDINQGCAGYVYGLWLSNIILNSSPKGSKILLLAGDTITHALDSNDQATMPIFGDAGTATVIENVNEDGQDLYSYFDLNMDGQGSDSIIVKDGGFRQISNKKEKKAILKMEGLKVYNYALKYVPMTVNNILDYSQVSIDDIDHIILHQANDFVINNIIKKMKWTSNKVPRGIVGRFGNHGPASIPFTISYSLGGDKIKDKKKLLLCGFGTGFSFASSIIELSNLFCPKPTMYQN